LVLLLYSLLYDPIHFFFQNLFLRSERVGQVLNFILKVREIRTVTLYVEEELIDAMAELVRNGKYPNRSEFVRSAIRDLIDKYQGS
jgi:metal-responsive CopG/Arc/MetJ family transcriptional regulator